MVIDLSAGSGEPLLTALATLRRSKITEGKPFPLGATWDGIGVNFAIFSAHATKVELCLFDESGQTEHERIELPEYTDEVWHGYLPAARPGTVYGYRVHGPYEPDAGHRFNPNKLVIDPYAKQLVGELRWGRELFGYQLEVIMVNAVARTIDSSLILRFLLLQERTKTGEVGCYLRLNAALRLAATALSAWRQNATF